MVDSFVKGTWNILTDHIPQKSIKINGIFSVSNTVVNRNYRIGMRDVEGENGCFWIKMR